jgi:hypothetical protein
MRLPRWLVLSLLSASVLAVATTLVAGVWWWSTAPERTARRFAALLANQDLDAANEMLSQGPSGEYRESGWLVGNPDNYFPKWTRVKLDQRPRSILDIIQQRSRFSIILDDEPGDPDEMLVVRDAIAIEVFGVISLKRPDDSRKPLRILRIEVRDSSDR